MNFDDDKEWPKTLSFDELLEGYAKPDSSGPKWRSTEPLWRRILRISRRVLMTFIDLVIMCAVLAMFFSAMSYMGNRSRHNLIVVPASPWPKWFDYFFLCFCAVYGFVRTPPEGWTEKGMNNLKRLRQVPGIATCAFAVVAIIIHRVELPTSLLVRISAAYDQSKPVKKKFKVVEERWRGDRNSGHHQYRISDPDDPSQREWDIHLDTPRPQLSVPPAYWTLNYHHSTFGLDWIDRSHPEPTYKLEDFMDSREEFSSNTMAFVHLNAPYSKELETAVCNWLSFRPKREIFLMEQFRSEGGGRGSYTGVPCPTRGGMGYDQFFQHLLDPSVLPKALPPKTAFVRCTNGKILQFDLATDQGRRDFLVSCQ